MLEQHSIFGRIKEVYAFSLMKRGEFLSNWYRIAVMTGYEHSPLALPCYKGAMQYIY